MTMLLLTVVLTGLAAMQVQVIRQVGGSRRANEATRLAQAIIERYKAMAFNEINNPPLLPVQWRLVKNAEGKDMRNVGVDGVSPGPFTVQEMLENVGTRKLITVRVSWLATSAGDPTDPAQAYQMRFVTMTTQRSNIP